MGHHRDNDDPQGIRCLDTYCCKNALEGFDGDLRGLDNTPWYISRVGEC